VIPSVLVLATGNPGKTAELVRLLAGWGSVEVRSLVDHPTVTLPEETGATYEANAVLKARAVAAATGLPALADDSGLEVDALGGAPGVTSARYGASDAERVARLLAALGGRPPAERTARFRCVVVLAWPDGRVVTAEGACEGTIADAPSGTGGFGYDPVFVSTELGRTFAEATRDKKARVSHRARALRALAAKLGGPLRGGDSAA
jgi:XTP/dITP diphosphohydrolase